MSGITIWLSVLVLNVNDLISPTKKLDLKVTPNDLLPTRNAYH
jgi:hypothetical protein